MNVPDKHELAGPLKGSGPAGVTHPVRVESAAYAAAGLSLVAALIHLWATPEHLDGWWVYGAFFIMCALAQGFLGIALLRWPGRNLIPLAGIWGNLAIVSMYVTTRTYGAPLGPEAGIIEDPGLLDMAATAAEFGVVVALVALLGGAYRRRMLNILLVLGIGVWTLRLTGLIP